MEVVIAESQVEIAQVVADAIESLVATASSPVLGLATGASPLPLYSELIERHRRGGLSFAAATMFLLDEYVGLAPDHPQSFRACIRRSFTDHIDVSPKAVYGPDGNAPDLTAACLRYEAAISQAGGIDLQILGIGGNGHIGFNEPGSSFTSRTHLTTLTERTRSDNAPSFDDPGQMPHHALTQGIGTILESRRLMLIASGPNKSDPIKHAIEGPVSAAVPASALQLHPHATFVIDSHAASGLQHAYCRRTSRQDNPFDSPLHEGA